MIPSHADVVIIGGGVLGTSAAFHLAERGVVSGKIVLLDRGPLASGTTPQAAGQTGYLNRDRLALEFGAYCIEFFENFEARTGQPIDFHQSGSLRVAWTENHLQDLESRAAAAADFGDTVRFLSAEEARQAVPGLQPPSGCRILQIPRDGYVEPKSVAVAYATAAQQRGVQFVSNLAASNLIVQNGRVRGVQTAAGAIEAEWVVVAAGAWSRQFCAQRNVRLDAVPVRHQAFVTAPLADVSAKQPIVRFTEPQIYVRPYDGGLLVGGYGYRPLSFDMNDFPPGFEIAALEADGVYYHELAEAAAPFFPCLREALVVQHRRGLPMMSPDGKLLVSEAAEMPGLILVSGCCVGGVDRSPGVGRMVADLVAGETGWIDPQALSADRFGDRYRSDARLRSDCEQAYAHHYHSIY